MLRADMFWKTCPAQLSSILSAFAGGMEQRSDGEEPWGSVYRAAMLAQAPAMPKGLTLAVKLPAARESAIQGPNHDTALSMPSVDGRDACPNNQAKLHDARFTNHLCWDHQPPEVQDAYLLGYLFGGEDIHAANANEPQQQQQQRSRRRRSRQKPKSAPATTQPTILAEPRNQASEDPSPSSDDDDVIVAAHQLSTIGEEPEREDAMRSTQISRQEKPGTASGTAPGTPTARRSQKTVHFADPVPRASVAAEKPSVETTADTRVAEPLSSSAAARLRTSHHRRSLDGRSGYRSSPKTSGSVAAPATNNRERRHSTGSAPKSVDVKRTTRTRANR
ncbi:hypothetical protein CPAR01_06599 [Colletotrichum paranaense]|uniref:Uncharacterized protein n=1 Tax=Colletotrichum paranaense TaxID=1914294 RepID=A0ABQ9SM57_9PEZI|nr:uncharacterized protein CPAR01_06599 [Colletotrichum paranaense]KAK1540610.1 hypothetical protein CPAR01_06599 [Colletotrichum paranaense]